MRIPVLLVDDQAAIRTGLAEILGYDDDLVVVGEAGTGEEGVAVARAVQPSIIVLDLRMPGRDGLWAISAIRADPIIADTPILVLTTFENDANVVTALRAGANGFVGKTAPQHTLVEAVRTVAGGESWLSTVAATSVVNYLNALSPGKMAEAERIPGAIDLTAREREMVVLVATGLSNDDIARRLSISRYTVKTHVNRAMAKLGVADRAGLVVIAYRAGLVDDGTGGTI